MAFSAGRVAPLPKGAAGPLCGSVFVKPVDVTDYRPANNEYAQMNPSQISQSADYFKMRKVFIAFLIFPRYIKFAKREIVYTTLVSPEL